MFTVKIKQLRTKAKIGIALKERKKFQLLLITLTFSYKIKNRNNVDNIDNLQSYSKIKIFLKHFVEFSRFKTLEKLIVECSNALQKEFNIQSVFIKIEKPEVAKKYGCKSISVSK